MNDKFSWDTAIVRKKSKKPEWMKEKSQELLMKSIIELFEKKSKRVRKFEDFYHPSQIYDMCVLQEYYRRKYKVDSVDETDFFMRLMAGAGTAAHKHFQEHVFGPAKVLVGSWTCAKCGNDLGEDCLMPDKCMFCGAYRPHILYKEIEVLDKELKIRGRVDGVLALEEDCLLEMKTKGDKSFDSISKPTRKELFQVNIYMHLLDLNECMFTYINRDSYDFKFIVAKKDASIVNEVLTKIDTIETAVQNDEVPRKEDGKPFRRCRKCSSKVAQNCPFNEECWSLKDE